MEISFNKREVSRIKSAFCCASDGRKGLVTRTKGAQHTHEFDDLDALHRFVEHFDPHICGIEP
jgi:hypothetical protein